MNGRGTCNCIQTELELGFDSCSFSTEANGLGAPQVLVWG